MKNRFLGQLKMLVRF